MKISEIPAALVYGDADDCGIDEEHALELAGGVGLVEFRQVCHFATNPANLCLVDTLPLRNLIPSWNCLLAAPTAWR